MGLRFFVRYFCTLLAFFPNTIMYLASYLAI